MIEDRRFTWPDPFWQQPAWRWDARFQSGVPAAYLATVLAAKVMTQRRNGLIVNISLWASRKYVGNLGYGAAQAATDKMTRDMARELRDYNVSVVGLYPGLLRTENVMRFAQALDQSNSESPQSIGRAVAVLAGKPQIGRNLGGGEPRARVRVHGCRWQRAEAAHARNRIVEPQSRPAAHVHREANLETLSANLIVNWYLGRFP
jgi:NAD(P)-dependent dehydrogenase (short-subunit alcohol dehydrogenase family)